MIATGWTRRDPPGRTPPNSCWRRCRTQLPWWTRTAGWHASTTRQKHCRGTRTGVRGILTEEGMRLTSMGVRVRDGVVELTGDGDRQTMRLAEILVRSVPGVLDVHVVATRG
jgi:hypothetical protein